MRKLKLGAVIISLFLINLNCHYKESKDNVDLLDEFKKLYTIGYEDEDAAKHEVYDYIFSYSVDNKNNVYVGDIIDSQIDKYNQNGNYLFSFGREGQGPGEFEGIGSFAVNDKGILYTYSNQKKYFMLFDPKGQFIKQINFPDEFSNDYCGTIKIDKMNNVWTLFYSIKKGFQIIKFNKELNHFSIVHSDNKRKSLAYTKASMLPILYPDFDFDENRRLYITDSIDYTLYVYSTENNKLIRTYNRKYKKIKINKKDLIYNTGRGIMDIRNMADSILNDLEGANKYLPSIFGVNIINDNILLWSSERNEDMKFKIDIYDMNFNFIKSVYHYNFLPLNLVKTRNNRLYIPNMALNKNEFEKLPGRLSMFNVPYKIFVYKLE